MVDFTPPRSVSYADYLEAEQSSDIKHEWFKGAVTAMSRGTPEHARRVIVSDVRSPHVT